MMEFIEDILERIYEEQEQFDPDRGDGESAESESSHLPEREGRVTHIIVLG